MFPTKFAHRRDWLGWMRAMPAVGAFGTALLVAYFPPMKCPVAFALVRTGLESPPFCSDCHACFGFPSPCSF